MRVFVLVLFLGFLSSTANADPRTVEESFQRLKDKGINFQVFGTICEHLAKFRLEKEFPSSEYKLHIGIVYESPERTLGELDVTVFRKSDMESVAVTEVKCWRDLFRCSQKSAETIDPLRNKYRRFKHP